MTVAQIVTERIIRKLEEAIKNNVKCFWAKSWEGQAKQNYATGHKYHGINKLLLPDDEAYFLTYSQISVLNQKNPDMKISIKANAKRYLITYMGNVLVENKKRKTDKDPETLTIKLLRYYMIYKASDVENLPKKEVDTKDNEEVLSARDIVSKSVCEIKNVFGCDRAYYSPAGDYIVVPDIKQFKNSESYYATLFHEMIHSTGHENRLGRIKNAHFGDKSYSKEELIAEIGSAILMTHANISNEKTDEDNIAYLNGWVKTLKNDMNMIVVAAGQAEKASDYIINGGN